MRKKAVSMLLVISLIAACFMGCGKEKESPAQENAVQSAVQQQESASGDAQEAGILNESGYPIVNEPVTLKVGVLAPTASYQGPWADLEWIRKLQEESGITFEFVEYQDMEAATLMFTGRDYPDILFGAASDMLIGNAAEAGDICALDEYMEKYAPNWNRYLAENDLVRKTITSADGHIYSFPIIRDEPQNTNLRDQWFIRKDWLDQLELDVPETTEQLYNVLKAFRDNAGKGSIPEDAVPYYLYGVTNHVGGALDLINSFGVRVSAERYYVTVDENGKVEFNFANEAIKEPLAFIHRLVEEGLVSEEGFVDDWSTYIVKMKSVDSVLGCFHGALNPTTDGSCVPMGPLDSGNGHEPLMRVQTNAVNRNMFTVFKNCEYPEAAVRLADMIAEPNWSMQGLYGMFDGEYMTRNDDGTMIVHGYEADAQCLTSCPHNRVALLCSADLFEKLTYEEGNANYSRVKAMEELYEGHTMKRENLYPNVILSEKNQSRITELYVDISQHVSSTFSLWALNGGMEEGWEDYIAQLEALGLEEYLSLLQEELDAFNAK